jgi:predicted aspartyl protease
LQSKEGFTSNKSFKVWVQIGDRQVVTLIDSGATSNFIASRLLDELQLKVVDTPAYVIEVGRVRNQEVKFLHVFIMELGGS